MRNYGTYKDIYRFPIILELDPAFNEIEINALSDALIYRNKEVDYKPRLLVHPSSYAVESLQDVSKYCGPQYRKIPFRMNSYYLDMLLNSCMSKIDGSNVLLQYQYPELGKIIPMLGINKVEDLIRLVDTVVEMQSDRILSFIYDTATWGNPVALSVGKRPVHRDITEFLVPVSRESIISESKKGFKIIPDGLENLKKIIDDGIVHWNNVNKIHKDRVLMNI